MSAANLKNGDTGVRVVKGVLPMALQKYEVESELHEQDQHLGSVTESRARLTFWPALVAIPKPKSWCTICHSESPPYTKAKKSTAVNSPLEWWRGSNREVV